MNKALIAMLFCLSAASARAGSIYESMVIDLRPSTGTYCQSISTSAYTRVPPNAMGNMFRRNGIKVLNLPGNTANMGGITNVGENRVVASTPTNIARYDLLFNNGSPPVSMAIGDNIFLWLVSLHTSAETACWQEYIQGR